MTQQNELNKQSTFKRLRGYLRHYKLAFFVAVVSNLSYAGMDFLFVLALKPLTDEVLVNNNNEIMENVPFFIVLLLTVRGIASFISAYCMSWVGQNIVHKIQVEVVDKYLRLPSQYFDSNSVGKLVSKITFDTQQVATVTTDTFTKLLREGGVIIYILCFIFYTSWQLASLFLISAPLIGLIVSLASKRFKKISKNIQMAMGGLTQNTQEVVDGYKVIKSFGGEDFELKRFNLEAHKNRTQNIKMVATKAISTPLIQLIAGVSLALVIYFAGKQLTMGNLTAGDFVAMLGMMIMMLKPLKIISNLNSVFQKGMAAAQSVFETMDELEETDVGVEELTNVNGKVEFEKVNFSYNKENQTLSSVSFKIEAGQKFALVGKSGGGKSTVTNLLLRFYEASSGKVKIDDNDITNVTLKSLRKHISIVSQQVTLFNSSVAANIAYAVDFDSLSGSQRTIELEKIESAAKRAHAWDFIQRLPNGFEELIGENGSKLSGGQRQRLAIARALYKDAPIVILDEATSALDTEAERHIQAAFDSLTKNRTTLVIAHRLSTIEKADCILVMDEGEIVERGTHQQLLDNNSIYSNLYHLQFSKADHNQ
ncbi:MAG: lipid A export permease/ATP-binding protein MsbA [Kangiellaceae bacterium]|nr:lipid A export permease/ATP-binding protein MsbA [Kangiellaceae bacterium]